MDELLASLDSLRAQVLKLSSAAVAHEMEKAHLAAQVKRLSRENERHLELEKMLVARIKLLENALSALRKGDQFSLQGGDDPVKLETGARERRSKRKDFLQKALRDNLGMTTTTSEKEESNNASLLSRQSTSSKDELSALRSLAATLGATADVTLTGGAGEEEKKKPAAVAEIHQQPPTKHVDQQQSVASTELSESEAEMEARLAGMEVSQAMKRMMKGMGGKKGAGNRQERKATPIVVRKPDSEDDGKKSRDNKGENGSSAHRWSATLTQRHALDAVRAVAFGSASRKTSSGYLTVCASDDWTLRTGTGATLRGHRGPVLCVCVIPDDASDMAVSGGLDGCLYSWRVPPTDAGDLRADVRASVRPAHQEAIWGVRPCGEGRLVSWSSDHTVKLWSVAALSEGTAPDEGETYGLRLTIDQLASSEQVMTALDAFPSGKGLVALTNKGSVGSATVWDIEAQKSSSSFIVEDSTASCGPVVCGRCVVDANVLVTGHNGGRMSMWDVRSATLTTSFVSHTECVTCLDVDATASYLASGSSDASVRLWDFRKQTCLFDVVAHRKKWDEGVTALAFHHTLPVFCTGGADGVVKVFE